MAGIIIIIEGVELFVRTMDLSSLESLSLASSARKFSFSRRKTERGDVSFRILKTKEWATVVGIGLERGSGTISIRTLPGRNPVLVGRRGNDVVMKGLKLR